LEVKARLGQGGTREKVNSPCLTLKLLCSLLRSHFLHSFNFLNSYNYVLGFVEFFLVFDYQKGSETQKPKQEAFVAYFCSNKHLLCTHWLY
jgi:hypothetical protein